MPVLMEKLNLEWEVQPVIEICGTHESVKWTSKCGVYQTIKVNSKTQGIYFAAQYKDGKNWLLVEHESDGPTYAKKFKTLDQAVESCERHFCKKNKLVSVDTNKSTFLSQQAEQVKVVEVKAVPVPEKVVEKKKDRDRFGAKLGSRAAQINSVITEKPKSTKEIQVESGILTGIYDHMNALFRAGHVKKTKDGLYYV